MINFLHLFSIKNGATMHAQEWVYVQAVGSGGSNGAKNVNFLYEPWVINWANLVADFVGFQSCIEYLVAITYLSKYAKGPPQLVIFGSKINS